MAHRTKSIGQSRLFLTHPIISHMVPVTPRPIIEKVPPRTARGPRKDKKTSVSAWARHASPATQSTNRHITASSITGKKNSNMPIPVTAIIIPLILSSPPFFFRVRGFFPSSFLKNNLFFFYFGLCCIIFLYFYQGILLYYPLTKRFIFRIM